MPATAMNIFADTGSALDILVTVEGDEPTVPRGIVFNGSMSEMHSTCVRESPPSTSPPTLTPAERLAEAGPVCFPRPFQDCPSCVAVNAGPLFAASFSRPIQRPQGKIVGSSRKCRESTQSALRRWPLKRRSYPFGQTEAAPTVGCDRVCRLFETLRAAKTHKGI